MQFALVLTATRTRRDHAGAPNAIAEQDPDSTCCNPEIYGILISIFMQDCPFLIVRLLLIFKYKVVSYTNMFFTSKKFVGNCFTSLSGGRKHNLCVRTLGNDY
jgi:hypothetical protein